MNLNKSAYIYLILTLSLLSPLGLSTVNANGNQSGGLSLLEVPSAKAHALGEAYSAMTNEVSAFRYNPSALGTLNNGQASLMYKKGLVDDSYGQFLFGAPTRRGSIGLSIGYYNGGDIDLYDGTTERTVNVQRDLTMGLGYANEFRNVAFGVTGKYLNSELIETHQAHAFAVDAGVNIPVAKRMRMGLAIQNFGTQLKYVDEADHLPRIARAGATYAMPAGSFNTLFLLDAPYFLNEQEFIPSLGVEVSYGLLALRMGYKTGNDNVEEFSVGTGFMLGRASLDYSFGLVEDLNNQHRVSLALQFGNMSSTPKAEFVRRKKEHRKNQVVLKETDQKNKKVRIKPRHNLAGKRLKVNATASKIYKVKPGDSLAKISHRMYGHSNGWKKIYTANKHLMKDPRQLTVGQRIIIP